MVVIAGERAKNIKTGGLKNVMNFTAQHTVRQMFVGVKFLKLIKKILYEKCRRRGNNPPS
jgi:hypothetical protein